MMHTTESAAVKAPLLSTQPHAGAVLAAYATLGWVAIFFAFHVYWYAGGSFGNPGALPPLIPDSVGGWMFEIAVVAALLIGVWVCLAIARNWSSGRARAIVVGVAWLGCALLVGRGGAGIIDDLVRATGLLPNGLTGLSQDQVIGTATPSRALLWTGYSVDVYFLVGGILMGLAARLGRSRPTSS